MLFKITLLQVKFYTYIISILTGFFLSFWRNLSKQYLCYECWPRYLESVVRRLLLDYTKLKKGNGALHGLRVYIHSGTMPNNTARSPCWTGASPLGLDPSPVLVQS